MWQSLGPVLGWDRFWKKWFSEFLKRNEVGASQIGVERQKEPDVTGLPAQRLEGVGGKRTGGKEGTADWDLFVQPPQRCGLFCYLGQS